MLIDESDNIVMCFFLRKAIETLRDLLTLARPMCDALQGAIRLEKSGTRFSRVRYMASVSA